MRFLILFLLGVSGYGFGQKEAENPSTVLLPWNTLGIQADWLAKAKPGLEESWKLLETKLITNKAVLSQFFEKAGKRLTVNQKQKLKKFSTGKFKDQKLFVEPFWCHIRDQHIFFLQFAQAGTDILLLSEHVTYSRKEWVDGLKRKSLKQDIQQRTQTVLNRALRKVGKTPTSTAALQVGLGLLKESTRTDEGSHHCLNLLVEGKLAEKYTVIRSLGGENTQAARRGFTKPASLRRTTRYVLFDWQPKKQKTPFPANFEVGLRFVESVMGRRIGPQQKASYQFNVADQMIKFNLDPRTSNFLAAEAKSLSLNENPQVAKVYGAWIYLDRGRAWGLKVNDRLEIDDGSKTVKGHVVGYFGPDLKLKSPRGFPIHEGAIVYVRKGQTKTKVGQTYTFDQTSFPTPWPPGGKSK